MRIVFLFFLSLAILVLTSIGWYFNLSRLDSRHSIASQRLKHDKIDEIRYETDIEKVKRQAVDQILAIDEYTLERERGINKGQSFLFLAMFLSGVAVIVSFNGVASRGRPLKATVS